MGTARSFYVCRAWCIPNASGMITEPLTGPLIARALVDQRWRDKILFLGRIWSEGGMDQPPVSQFRTTHHWK